MPNCVSESISCGQILNALGVKWSFEANARIRAKPSPRRLGLCRKNGGYEESNVSASKLVWHFLRSQAGRNKKPVADKPDTRDEEG